MTLGPQSQGTGAAALALPALAAQLGDILARYDGPPPLPVAATRKPGRPLKRTPAYLRAVLAKHGEVEAWFLHEYEEAPRSDRALYTAYFTCVFTARGQRGSRASEPAFQRKLKTTLNELSAARRQEKANPGN
jgi:hypothetical protein